jgi:hypothetical protein
MHEGNKDAVSLEKAMTHPSLGGHGLGRMYVYIRREVPGVEYHTKSCNAPASAIYF